MWELVSFDDMIFSPPFFNFEHLLMCWFGKLRYFALLLQNQLHPFAEVNFQSLTFQTSSAEGPDPVWREEFCLDFRYAFPMTPPTAGLAARRNSSFRRASVDHFFDCVLMHTDLSSLASAPRMVTTATRVLPRFRMTSSSTSLMRFHFNSRRCAE